jgi:hypothetical protein
MTKLTPILAVAIQVVGVGIGEAADPMVGKEATPIIGERITKNTVKGMLMRVDGEYYWLEDADGKEIRLHVDSSTKREDKFKIIITGDQVKADITDNGHATTLQRDD